MQPPCLRTARLESPVLVAVTKAVGQDSAFRRGGPPEESGPKWRCKPDRRVRKQSPRAGSHEEGPPGRHASPAPLWLGRRLGGARFDRWRARLSHAWSATGPPPRHNHHTAQVASNKRPHLRLTPFLRPGCFAPAPCALSTCCLPRQCSCLVVLPAATRAWTHS